MNDTIQQKIRTLHWEKWLNREFSAFIASLFIGGHRKECYTKIGFKGFSVKAQLFQLGSWYQSQEVWNDMVQRLTPILKKKSIFDLTTSLAEFKVKSEKKMVELVRSVKANDDPITALAEIYQILTLNTSYIWLAHGLEEYYNIKLNKEVQNFVSGNIEEFIREASFPIKKNAHALMEEEIRAMKSSQGDKKTNDGKNIAEKYGWLKARGFGEPFTAKDIEEMKRNLSSVPEKQAKIKIPSELKQLFVEMQELVFYRTERTDIFYELLFLARPIFQRVAEKYKILFKEFPNYTIQSLISGKPVKLSLRPCMATFEEEFYLGNEAIIKDDNVQKSDLVQGKTAQKGIVQGRVKIVTESSELDKVQPGDILVTQMTFPAFIPAMIKAAAFVTDEGGLTCHAAIVAREMNKPCVIGTKIATKVFKDGDLVEVDADRGIVRKI